MEKCKNTQDAKQAGEYAQQDAGVARRTAPHRSWRCLFQPLHDLAMCCMQFGFAELIAAIGAKPRR
jgi:hypothetical protein